MDDSFKETFEETSDERLSKEDRLMKKETEKNSRVKKKHKEKASSKRI